MTRAEIEALEQKVADEPFRREAQRRLAWEVTAFVHGVDAATAAIDASQALFGQGELGALDAETLAAALRELPNITAPAGLTVVQALVDTGLCSSLGEARRAVAQGGVSLDNVKVADEASTITGALPGGVSVLRRGKKTLAGIFIEG